MLYSNDRKLCLSGWLLQNNSIIYDSPLRLQKFLFFYEAFSKVSGEEADFDRLKGYKRGPVFSTVWGDYTKDRTEFNIKITEKIKDYPHAINLERAYKTAFLVSTMSEQELSKLTHRYQIWNAKRARIMAGEQQVELSEADFGSQDYLLTSMLEEMYSNNLVKNSVIVPIGEKYFVFSQDDRKKLTEVHLDTMSALAESQGLQNPIFTSIGESGELIVD